MNTELSKLIRKAERIMDGDSNDAEHEALFELVEFLKGDQITDGEIHFVATPSDDDNDEEIDAVFTSRDKASEYIAAEFDPERIPAPYIGTLPLNPTPKQRAFVTVWHTCIDIQTGEFGEKGRAERVNAADEENAADQESVTPTTYNLGYANVYSRVSAEDSIRRAAALRTRELAKQPA